MVNRAAIAGGVFEFGRAAGDPDLADGLEDRHPERGKADACLGRCSRGRPGRDPQGNAFAAPPRTTKIQADQAAILSSMGLTAAQVTQIQSDQQALQTAITTASTSTGTSTGTSTEYGQHDDDRRRRLERRPRPSSAVQTAMQTLQTDLKTDTPSSPTTSHEAIGHGAG